MNSGSASNGRHENGRTTDAWDELLSAYLDGEVTESERIFIEQRLAADSAAREMLCEFEQLSHLVRSLPRVTAPVELQPATVKLAEQRSLLGAATPAAKSTHPRLRRREWLAGLTGLVATIIAVTVIPSWYWSPAVPAHSPGEFRFAAPREFVVGGSLDSEQDSARSVVTVALGDGAEPEALRSKVAMSRSAPADGAPGSRSMRRAGIAVKDERRTVERNQPTDSMEIAAAAAPAQAGEKALGKSSEVAPDSGLERLEAWQEVQPYLNGFCQNTGAVANFDLVVLDTREAVDQFEVLLMQNGVMVTQPSEPQDQRLVEEPVAAAARSPMKSTERLADGETASRVAMYVEADGEPITKALAEMVRRRQLLSLKLQPPLQVPAADDEAPADEPAEFSRNRYVVKDLRDAYWVARFGSNGVQLSEEAPVSASLGVSNVEIAQGLQPAAGAPFLTQNAPVAGQSHNRLAMGNSVNMKNGEAPTNYSQRVVLETPQTDWLKQLQLQQQSATANTQEDLAFEAQLRNTGNNSVRKLQQNFLATAPNTVRVLFVMQEAAVGLELEAVGGGVAPMAPPAKAAKPR
ncbi:MAG: hypothetical protein SFV23_20875 [Planctomycetaceae bacterium]|nr:hypothetical protein [Planctomycetaceae bacterium]